VDKTERAVLVKFIDPVLPAATFARQSVIFALSGNLPA
jgi:hypothetical protein